MEEEQQARQETKLSIYQNTIKNLYKNVKTFNPGTTQIMNSQSVWQRFQNPQQIGQGAFCRVWSAERQPNYLPVQQKEPWGLLSLDELNRQAAPSVQAQDLNKKFALKEMNDGPQQHMVGHGSIKEVMTLRKLDHPNIACNINVHYNHLLNDLSSYDASKKDFKMYIEMEQARHDLQALRREENFVQLEPSQIKCILKQIAEGIKYLHEEKRIVHRDIKPQNILWYEGGLIKITDFNHAIELDKLLNSKWRGNNCGTHFFKAPELLFDLPYTQEIDIWAFGCVFEFLLTGSFIFKFMYHKLSDVEKKNENLKSIFRHLGIPSNKQWPGIEKHQALAFIDKSKCQPKLREYLESKGIIDEEAIDLLEKMFIMNPKERITINEILQHPYLNNGVGDMSQLPNIQTTEEYNQFLIQKHKEMQEQKLQQQQQIQQQKQLQQQQQQQKQQKSQVMPKGPRHQAHSPSLKPQLTFAENITSKKRSFNMMQENEVKIHNFAHIGGFNPEKKQQQAPKVQQQQQNQQQKQVVNRFQNQKNQKPKGGENVQNRQPIQNTPENRSKQKEPWWKNKKRRDNSKVCFLNALAAEPNVDENFDEHKPLQVSRSHSLQSPPPQGKSQSAVQFGKNTHTVKFELDEIQEEGRRKKKPYYRNRGQSFTNGEKMKKNGSAEQQEMKMQRKLSLDNNNHR